MCCLRHRWHTRELVVFLHLARAKEPPHVPLLFSCGRRPLEPCATLPSLGQLHHYRLVPWSTCQLHWQSWWLSANMCKPHMFGLRTVVQNGIIILKFCVEKNPLLGLGLSQTSRKSKVSAMAGRCATQRGTKAPWHFGHDSQLPLQTPAFSCDLKIVEYLHGHRSQYVSMFKSLTSKSQMPPFPLLLTFLLLESSGSWWNCRLWVLQMIRIVWPLWTSSLIATWHFGVVSVDGSRHLVLLFLHVSSYFFHFSVQIHYECHTVLSRLSSVMKGLKKHAQSLYRDMTMDRWPSHWQYLYPNPVRNCWASWATKITV